MVRFRASDWLRPSVLVLVGANLFPIYQVLFGGWTVSSILILYWLENVLVGCFNVLRMLVARPGGVWSPGAKAALIPFFVLHYGVFTVFHGLFVFTLFVRHSGAAASWQDRPTFVSGGGALGYFAQLMCWQQLGYVFLALAASHAFSFFWNYLGQGEYRRTSLDDLMVRPYSRVAVLHVVIILGGLLVAVFHTPVVALVLLVALKIGMDLAGHLREHQGIGAFPVED
jgi:hypothetical protein